GRDARAVRGHARLGDREERSRARPHGRLSVVDRTHLRRSRRVTPRVRDGPAHAEGDCDMNPRPLLLVALLAVPLAARAQTPDTLQKVVPMPEVVVSTTRPGDHTPVARSALSRA